MHPEFTVSRTSVSLIGTPVPGAEDRQKAIRGFDQAVFSKSSVTCIGAGGLISHIARTLVRKGIGGITVIDDDIVEASNLNRQHFYAKDIGQNKAVALASNLQPECIAATNISGLPFRFQEAVALKANIDCDVAICGVDNNPARVAVSRYYRLGGIPVIFTAVSREGDHGYVFVQESEGPCIGCLYPDMADDDRYPCPGTPAIADILQVMGALAVYAVDTLIMPRPRTWNYRRLSLPDGEWDGSMVVLAREGCRVHPSNNTRSNQNRRI